MAFLELPNEILLQIIELFPTRKTIQSIVKANRRFYDMANDGLYLENIRSGSSALFWAAEGGHVDVVCKMILLGANVNTAFQKPHYYDRSSEALPLGVRCQLSDPCHAPTALHVAAHNGHFTVVTALLERLSNLEAIDNRGFTPLAVAVASRRGSAPAMVKILLEAGADVQGLDRQSQTPLCMALKSRQETIAHTICRFIGDTVYNSIIDYEKEYNPLHVAARYCLPNMVRIFIEKGADINAKDYDGRTALHLALLGVKMTPSGERVEAVMLPTGEDRYETVRLLLRLGADPGLRDAVVGTPRQLAMSSSDERVRELFQVPLREVLSHTQALRASISRQMLVNQYQTRFVLPGGKQPEYAVSNEESEASPVLKASDSGTNPLPLDTSWASAYVEYLETDLWLGSEPEFSVPANSDFIDHFPPLEAPNPEDYSTIAASGSDVNPKKARVENQKIIECEPANVLKEGEAKPRPKIRGKVRWKPFLI